MLLARSGVLLLTWTDPTGALGKLRRQLHHTFPGACSKQSNIIHTSLFRVVETPLSEAAAAAEQATGASQQQHSSQLSVEAVAAITAACERWTEKVGGGGAGWQRWGGMAVWLVWEGWWGGVGWGGGLAGSRSCSAKTARAMLMLADRLRGH